MIFVFNLPLFLKELLTFSNNYKKYFSGSSIYNWIDVFLTPGIFIFGSIHYQDKNN